MHVLQPKHIKLKEDEAVKLLVKYNIIKEQLPRIKISDPAIADLSIKKGDVVRILRKDEGGSENEYFRVVV